MNPRIEQLHPKKLIGKRLTMSLVENKTGQLWTSFSPLIKEINHKVGQDKISLQIYPRDYYINFSPTNEFVKWAAVEVSSLDDKSEDLEHMMLEGGLYAVFDYKGSSTDPCIFQYIFSEWIPQSKYIVDDRPHFEVLGKKYKNNDPNSEEEIWIPIKER